MKQVLLTQCADEPGLIATITQQCFAADLNIIRNDEYVDKENKRFFMRTELEGNFEQTDLLQALKKVLPNNAHLALKDRRKVKVVLLATKEAHCLGGVLLKCFEQALNIEIQAVIANYPDLEPLVKGFNVPFYCISHQGLTRHEHDSLIAKKINELNPDLIGLAKYMRILSPEFVAQFSNKIINIHHSFLPAFIGAKPYHQAYQRGVKMIGATAHFVTNELDEGPIIEQDICHVRHDHSVEKLTALGRDVEKNVFCRALQWAAEHRIFISGNKTVVFK